jgi:hypothetical protein
MAPFRPVAVAQVARVRALKFDAERAERDCNRMVRHKLFGSGARLLQDIHQSLKREDDRYQNREHGHMSRS